MAGYPIYPLKKNNIFLKKQNLKLTGADTQIYSTYLRLNYKILHKNIQTGESKVDKYILLPVLPTKLLSQYGFLELTNPNFQQGGWEGNK